MLLDEYDKLIGQCVTLNQVNKVHIAFGNTLTPAEIAQLWRNLFAEGRHKGPSIRAGLPFSAEEVRVAAREWIDKEMAHVLFAGKDKPEPFLRRELRKSVTLFTGPSTAGERTLVLALPGANHHIMMGIPAFLQHFDASRIDIVIIRDGNRSGYRRGLDGLGETVDAFADGLPELLGFSRYAQVVGVGVSAGGLPTILAGLRLGLKNVLVSGAGSPMDPRWLQPGIPSPTEALQRGAAAGGIENLTIVYGAQSEEDKRDAFEIQGLIGGELVEISQPGREVKHNALFPIVQRGEFAAFIRERLRLPG